MSKETLIGHKNIIEYFNLLYKKDMLSHAYLFIGKEGIGKRMTARFIAMLLNCKNEARPCFMCASCLGVQKGNQPDVMEIYPETSIGIQNIREIQKRTYLKNFSSSYKVIIIDEADALTMEAANAFLKTLEEPPLGVIFFLITSKPENLPVTIRSRTKKIWFTLKHREIKEHLLNKGLDSNRVNFLLKLSEGRFSIIEKMVKQNYALKKEQIFGKSFIDIHMSNRASLKSTAQLIISFLRDCLLYKINDKEDIVNTDLMGKISDYQGRFDVRQLLDKADSLLLINQTLDNINVNLANNLIRSILS